MDTHLQSRLTAITVGTIAGVSMAGCQLNGPNDPSFDEASALDAAIASPPKTVALVEDQDGSGTANPGDVLEYTIVIENTGDVAATSVTYSDALDPNTAFVDRSATATQGTVGDFPQSPIDLGRIEPGATVTILFRVTVEDFSSEVVDVCNQGTVAGDNFSPVMTDDPDTPDASDPTCAAVFAGSLLIDIKPGSDPASINPKSRGVIPVAILGSAMFDVNDVDRTTLTFGPADASPTHKALGHIEDVNDDGFMDLVTHYRTQESGIVQGDTEACVTGNELDGTSLGACDAIRTVGN